MFDFLFLEEFVGAEVTLYDAEISGRFILFTSYQDIQK